MINALTEAMNEHDRDRGDEGKMYTMTPIEELRARIEAAARESAVEITSKAQQKAVEAKNDIMAKKRADTESEIAAIMGAAKKQAGSIRAKRLSETDVAEISQDI